MTASVSTTHAREHFGDVLAAVSAGEDTILTSHNRPVAVLISPKAYAALLAAEDEALGRLAAERLANLDLSDTSTLDEVMAETVGRPE